MCTRLGAATNSSYQAMQKGIQVYLNYHQENRKKQFCKLYVCLTILHYPVVKNVMCHHTLQ